MFGPALRTQTPANHPAAISFCFEQLLGLAIYSARKTAESFSEGKIIYLDNYFEDGNYKRSLMGKLLKCLLLSGGKTFLCLATALVGPPHSLRSQVFSVFSCRSLKLGSLLCAL